MVEKKLQKLIDIMATLRGPDGCPWDREQTHQSLKPYLLEEAYEVLETLDQEDYDHFKDELGDLLLQVVFHAQVAKEAGRFDMSDVIDAINEKLIRRHPHVFGDVNITTAEEQRIHWEKIKKKEGKKSVVDGVPRNLPALIRAKRVQSKASTVGFDWGEAAPVWEKIDEETVELKQAIQTGNQATVAEEFGDLLFALVNLSRFIHVDPEDALQQGVNKFIRRFQRVETTMKEDGKSMSEATLEEMDAVWNRIKKEEP